VLQKGEVTGPHGAEGLGSLDNIMLGQDDPVLKMELAIDGVDVWHLYQAVAQTLCDGRDDAGTGDAGRLPVHGALRYDRSGVGVDRVAFLCQDSFIKNSALPVH